MMSGARFERISRSERGAAAVEFAIVMILLITIVGAIIDFGFMFNAQISLTHAAREGVRVEAIGTGDPVASAEDAFGAVVGVTDFSAQVDQACPDDDGARLVTSATYNPRFAGFIPALVGPFNLDSEAVMRCGG
jgi:Flp pilus assembly pilin Flp